MINFDQAATSFPKPLEVVETYDYILRKCQVNPNRGFSKENIEISELIFETRDKINRFFNGYGVENVVFSSSVTMALNQVIQGYLSSNDHVLISSIEHNAVYRLVEGLKNKINIDYDVIPSDEYGNMDINTIEPLINKRTRAIISTFGSNICSTVNPLNKIGEICKKNNLDFIVDSAQGAGVLEIDMKRFNISALCFTGHKSLMGVQGTGGFLLNDSMVDKINPLIFGGTGSISDSELMPSIMPDKLEAGTLHTAGIISLGKGIDYILNKGLNNIHKKEMVLFNKLIRGLRDNNKIRLIGYNEKSSMLPVILIQSNVGDESSLAQRLDDEGIITRIGLHCAPLAHKTIGSFPRGGIRLSLGYFNNDEEVDKVLNIINNFQ